MVERTLGKGEVGSSILPSSTIPDWWRGKALRFASPGVGVAGAAANVAAARRLALQVTTENKTPIPSRQTGRSDSGRIAWNHAWYSNGYAPIRRAR